MKPLYIENQGIQRGEQDCSPLSVRQKLAAQYFELVPYASDRVVFLLIFGLTFLLRLPFRAQFLVNWDAVNFALATKAIDLHHHQPHPPGYIGFVAVGSLLNHITGDPNVSLTLISVFAGALSPALLFMLAARFMARRYAIGIAIVLALSPVVWYYSQVGLTYSAELAIGLGFLLMGYNARTQLSVKHLIGATVLLVLLGAVRQSGALLLMPLWLYIAWPFPRRTQVGVIGVLVAGNLAWLVPLMWLSGGPMTYLKESAGLAGFAVTPLSVFSLNVWGLMRNFGFVFGGFLISLNLGLLTILIARKNGINAIGTLLRHDRWFFLLWVVPALLTYLLVHTGQLGYVLLVLPIGFLLVGSAINGFADCEQTGRLKIISRMTIPYYSARRVSLILLAALALVNVFSFFFLPKAIYAMARTDGAGIMRNLVVGSNEDPKTGAMTRARQYDLDRNDAHWQELLDIIQGYNPESTAVLAVPDGSGSYRQLAYYLADKYTVYGLGRDIHGEFGYLFKATDGADSYSIDGLRVARKTLILPSRIQWLIIPDPGIDERINDQFYKREISLDSEGTVVIVKVPSKTTLRIRSIEGDTPLMQSTKLPTTRFAYLDY